MSSESVRSNKVKILNNKPFLLQHPNHKQKSYGALSQKLHCRRHILFTVKPANLKSRLLVEHIDLLRAAYVDVQKQYPFETVAVCVLPNHIHAIWTLPPDDVDYSLRWRLIKTKFSAHFPHAENLSVSKQRRNERGIWQRRFTNTPCATKSICSVARTTSISIPSNMDCAAMSAIGRFRRFTVMCGTDGCR